MGESVQRETIAARLRRYFAGRGFSRVDTHSESMELYYTAVDGRVSLIWMVMAEAVEEMTSEQYRKRLATICRTFTNGTYQGVHTLTLFLTKNTEKARSLGADTPFWIVDETYGRLIIYENQMEDFLGIRSMIEQNLHFGADIRNENGIQKKGVLSESRMPEASKASTGTVGINDRYPQTRPLTRRKPLPRQPFITITLVVINAIIYLAQILHPAIEELGANYWIWIKDEHQYYRLFTCMFLHGSPDHLINNMLTLWVIGSIVEDEIGHWKYLFAYLVGGLAAGVASCLYFWSSGLYVYSVGASGAIFAITGIFAVWLVTTPEKRADISPARLILFTILILYELGIFQSFGHSETTIDYAAHIGGFVFGLMFALTLVAFRKDRKQRTM